MRARTRGLINAAAFVFALSILMSGCGSIPESINTTSSQGTTPSATYKKGTFPIPVGPPNASVIANELLTPEPGHPCGEWSAEYGSVGSYVIAHYGDERDCGLLDDSWVITTLGLRLTDGSRAQGIIALYHCGPDDAACLDGSTDHPLAGWSFIAPPYPGGVTWMGEREPDTIIVDNGGPQLEFNVATEQFSREAPD